jgi:uncharacterized repeat protein (TIGR02543 family)
VAVTYTANFTQNANVTITYVAGTGGTVDRASESVPPATGSPLGSTATADPGYTFSGWTSSLGTDLTVLGAAKVSPEKNGGVYVAVTYTANFTVKSTYTVKYETHGGTPVGDKTNVAWTAADLLPATPPTRTGYTLEGWYTQADGAGTKVTPTTTYATIAGGVDVASVTIHANWEANTYTVTFEDWDGTVLKTETNVPHGTAATPPATSPTRSGFIFKGWNKDFSNVTENLVVTAVYEQETGLVGWVIANKEDLVPAPMNITLPRGMTAEFIALYFGEPVTGGNKWSIAETTFATVNENTGVVTANKLKVGQVTLMLKDLNGNLLAKLLIRIV